MQQLERCVSDLEQELRVVNKERTAVLKSNRDLHGKLEEEHAMLVDLRVELEVNHVNVARVAHLEDKAVSMRTTIDKVRRTLNDLTCILKAYYKLQN